MQSVEVGLDRRSYSILVGSNLLAEAGNHIAPLVRPGRAMIITDDHVAGLYLKTVRKSLEKAGFAVAAANVPPGETSKSVEELARLWEACYAAELERGSVVVALGGGVVGDLAGLAAATYLRGLPLVQMPTTLLAQVDSSVGGKTAINLSGGKNLVGAFHQPVLVLADVAALDSLDKRQFAAGMAEVVKHAMIRDAALFERIELVADRLARRQAAVLEEIVAWNCRIKAAVVAADEREGGLRAILNYGHTVGHAVERVAEYGTYTHGEAVALGMVAEAQLARFRGLIDDQVVARQRDLLARFDLPLGLRRRLPVEPMLEAMRHDKKVRGGRVRIVLPEAVGAVRIVDDVTDDELREVIDRLQPGG